MFSLFLLSLGHLTSFLGRSLAAFVDVRRSLFSRLLLLLAAPLFVLLQLLQWLLLLLDELLFPAYRSTAVRAPLFIIGPPRTGTTFMHHVLAADEQATTFTLWECLFGVSICGRQLCRGLMWLDRRVAGAGSKVLRLLARPFSKSMDDVHPLSMTHPEEDFLLFLPLGACFLLSVPFPDARWLFSFYRFDDETPARDRRLVMQFYRRCVQKHLYIAGGDRRFLSKNASFPGFTHSLLETFPDARIISTWRDPVEAMPSQLSALRPGMQAMGFASIPDSYRDELLELTIYYYRHMLELEQQQPARVQRISNRDMRERLAESVRDAFAALGLPVSASLDAELERRAQASRRHSSSHEYTLEEFGLSEELIRSRFPSADESS